MCFEAPPPPSKHHFTRQSTKRPKTWAQHHLGLSISNAITGHIHRAFTRLSNPSSKSYYPKRRQRQSPTSTVTPAPPIVIDEIHTDHSNNDQPSNSQASTMAPSQDTTNSYCSSNSMNPPASLHENCPRYSDLSDCR